MFVKAFLRSHKKPPIGTWTRRWITLLYITNTRLWKTLLKSWIKMYMGFYEMHRLQWLPPHVCECAYDPLHSSPHTHSHTRTHSHILSIHLFHYVIRIAAIFLVCQFSLKTSFSCTFFVSEHFITMLFFPSQRSRFLNPNSTCEYLTLFLFSISFNLTGDFAAICNFQYAQKSFISCIIYLFLYMMNTTVS